MNPRPDRMTLAVPNKGRLVAPTLESLHAAGLVFEERDRSLMAHVENVPLDILFVRTGDVVEFVRDRVADVDDPWCGPARGDGDRPPGRAGVWLWPVSPCR